MLNEIKDYKEKVEELGSDKRKLEAENQGANLQRDSALNRLEEIEKGTETEIE